jgi:hypothetical protein
MNLQEMVMEHVRAMSLPTVDWAGQAGRGLRLSPHAAVRMQQRGVKTEVLAHLLHYGRWASDHLGGQIVLFDEQALNRLSRHEPPPAMQAVRDHRDVYAVVSGDGCVVTVGHRYKRVMRDKSLVNKRPRGWRR